MLGEFLNHSILGKTARYWERIDLSTKVQPLLPICTLLRTCSLAAWPTAAADWRCACTPSKLASLTGHRGQTNQSCLTAQSDLSF